MSKPEGLERRAYANVTCISVFSTNLSRYSWEVRNKHVGLHASGREQGSVWMKTDMAWQIQWNFPNIKFHEDPLKGSSCFMRADWQIW